jgi:hypothetical protein
MKMTIYVFHTAWVAKSQGQEEDCPQAAYLLERVTGFADTVSVQIPTDNCYKTITLEGKAENISL